MNATTRLTNAATSTYIVALLALTGVFALITAVLIAWPALAYLGAKLF